jgi:hypothetical protein
MAGQSLLYRRQRLCGLYYSVIYEAQLGYVHMHNRTETISGNTVRPELTLCCFIRPSSPFHDDEKKNFSWIWLKI